MARGMCRMLSVIILVLAALAVPPAYPQDSGDFARDFFRRLDEQRQRDQRRRENDLVRGIAPHWRACEAGDIDACRRAAQFPLNAHGRALLFDLYQRAQIQRDMFEINWHNCADGNVAACDAALGYPFATDRATLTAWREVAIARLHLEQERLEVERREADERARVEADRQSTPVRSVTSDHAALTTQSAPSRLPAFAPDLSPGLVFVLILTIFVIYLLPLKIPASLASIAAFRASFDGLLRPLPHSPRSFSTHAPSQEPSVMHDDRELLAATPSPWPSRPPGGSEPATRQVMAPGEDRIRVKIRRSQASSFVGKVTFSVNFIAELSPEAREAVRRYKFGKTVLYQKDPKLDISANIFRYLWRLLWLMLTRKRWQITISDLVNGRTIECKDILEVLDVEERIMGAAKMFASVLRAAAWFGGEEIVQL